MATLRENLQRIYQERGQLTAPLVLEDARPEGSELHDRFEWDDSVAGEQYRLVQASELIRSCKITYSPPGSVERHQVRAFSSVRQDPDRQGYVPTEEALENSFTRKLLLQQCEREIADLKRKYGHLTEFAEMLRDAVA